MRLTSDYKTDVAQLNTQYTLFCPLFLFFLPSNLSWRKIIRRRMNKEENTRVRTGRKYGQRDPNQTTQVDLHYLHRNKNSKHICRWKILYFILHVFFCMKTKKSVYFLSRTLNGLKRMMITTFFAEWILKFTEMIGIFSFFLGSFLTWKYKFIGPEN